MSEKPITYSCQCGRTQSYSYTEPANCEGCDHCHTTLEKNGDDHTKPDPHRYVTMMDHMKDKEYLACIHCGKRN